MQQAEVSERARHPVTAGHARSCTAAGARPTPAVQTSGPLPGTWAPCPIRVHDAASERLEHGCPQSCGCGRQGVPGVLSPRSRVTPLGPTPSEAVRFPAAAPPPRLCAATASGTWMRPLSLLAVLSWPPLVTADAWPSPAARPVFLCSKGLRPTFPQPCPGVGGGVPGPVAAPYPGERLHSRKRGRCSCQGCQRSGLRVVFGLSSCVRCRQHSRKIFYVSGRLTQMTGRLRANPDPFVLRKKLLFSCFLHEQTRHRRSAS